MVLLCDIDGQRGPDSDAEDDSEDRLVRGKWSYCVILAVREGTPGAALSSLILHC